MASTSYAASFSPETIRPFPQAEPRKATKRARRKTLVLTDTPVKENLEKEKAAKKNKGSTTKAKRKIAGEKKDHQKGKECEKRAKVKERHRSTARKKYIQ